MAWYNLVRKISPIFVTYIKNYFTNTTAAIPIIPSSPEISPPPDPTNSPTQEVDINDLTQTTENALTNSIVTVQDGSEIDMIADTVVEASAYSSGSPALLIGACILIYTIYMFWCGKPFGEIVTESVEIVDKVLNE